MTLLTLLQSQVVAPSAVVQQPTALGGGWDANEFAKLRRELARKKKRLRKRVEETIAVVEEVEEEAAPVAAPAMRLDPLAPLVQQLRTQLAEIEAAVTRQALAVVEQEIAALRERIEDELDDEETLLLLAA